MASNYPESNKYTQMPIEEIVSELKIKLQRSNQLLKEIISTFIEIRGD